jgi:hypothetical protein
MLTVRDRSGGAKIDRKAYSTSDAGALEYIGVISLVVHSAAHLAVADVTGTQTARSVYLIFV